MKINKPIFIRRTKKRGYEITGSLDGYGTVRRYGRSEEEAKDKFFKACNEAGKGMSNRNEGIPIVRRAVY